jgi:predicted PurR-regulated permease PerM
MTLGRVGVAALFVAMLALGRPVLMPVALAFYLTFVLTPPSDWLERRGAPRALSLTVVLVGTLSLFAALGSVLLAQAAALAAQMNSYSAQISDKLARLRTGGLSGFTDLQKSLSDLGKAVDPDWALDAAPAPVRVIAEGSSPLSKAEQALGPILGPLALFMIVVVMVVFMMAHREDLRGRLIQLVGPRNVTLTTRTMADAVNRVSHLLLTQLYVNAGFGAVIALGLYGIGIPYALLWGTLAAVLRFVPLLGALISAILPTMVALAIFPGWREVLLTAGLFVGVDTLIANLVEPWIVGKRTGVSALALLISALFWTWLWGPLGLLLATPITVCAAAVARHVPELSFLNTLLGDETGLESQVNFYQRVLAKAGKDALRIARRYAARGSLQRTFDELFVPTLDLVTADEQAGAINHEDVSRVVADLRDIVGRLPAARSNAAPATNSLKVLGIAAGSEADGLLLQMLAIAATSVDLQALPVSDRTAVISAARESEPQAIWIAALTGGANVNARFYCRRLRALFPALPIWVISPGSEGKSLKEAAARLREAGASDVVASVSEAVRLLTSAAVGNGEPQLTIASLQGAVPASRA